MNIKKRKYNGDADIDYDMNNAETETSESETQTEVSSRIINNNIYNHPNTFYVNFTMNDDSTNPVLLNFPNHGIFDILIRPKDDHSKTHSKFTIAKINSASIGQVTRIFSIRCNNCGAVDMNWNSSGVHIYYRPAPGTPTTTEYIMKVTTV